MNKDTIFLRLHLAAAGLVGMTLQFCHANESGVARISTWKSLSNVADRAEPMHVARQHVLAAPQT